ncbi:sialidase family protein [Brachyspira pilosicoli]|uniref:sialidase family protein n=1 Tax=Brachyspira pilosicoli TaxID=52584 RepID=UPI00255C9C65|nr:sialidase family protein [Brachyspira pilosicoli]
MSKKIIYLLSLLMALSLVFASCKKNAAGTGDLTPPPVDNETGKEDANQDTGLFEDYNKIPVSGAIREYEVFQNTGRDTYRNPVVVSVGNGVVFAFGELRYETPGAANDVGINGENTVDIVYKSSANSGYDWDSQLKYVGGQAGSKENAHGAPNVFLLGNNKIVVVATAGGGIGRTAYKVGETGKVESRVEYIFGTISGTEISWGKWTEVQLSSSKIIDEIKKVKAATGREEVFNQYGTAPGRGVVLNSGSNILLSLVVANQGSTKTEADIRELMGRYVLKGTVAGNTITWEAVEGQPIAYTTQNVTLGPWKETQLYGGTDTEPKFFVVPSPWAPSSVKNLKLGRAKGKNQTPTATSIVASEGAAGYVDLTGKWFGKNTYNPKDLKNGGNYSILTHVQETGANLAMYVLDNASDNFDVKGTWKVSIPEVTGTAAKSSSIDVLPDGTIIAGFEFGRPAEVPEGFDANKLYKVFFARYSQAYIANKTGN